MNVLLLGPVRTGIIDTLTAAGDQILQTEDKISPDDGNVLAAEFLVSYGYRHLIKSDVLNRFPNRAINLHISYLPYNRGADPNLWSIIDGTPSGVTIHRLDESLDTGEIIEQRIVQLSSEDTLRSSYERLSRTIELLFESCWPLIRTGKCASVPQHGQGTSHRLKDRQAVEHLLRLGWDTPILELQEVYKKHTQEVLQ